MPARILTNNPPTKGEKENLGRGVQGRKETYVLASEASTQPLPLSKSFSSVFRILLVNILCKHFFDSFLFGPRHTLAEHLKTENLGARQVIDYLPKVIIKNSQDPVEIADFLNPIFFTASTKVNLCNR